MLIRENIPLVHLWKRGKEFHIPNQPCHLMFFLLHNHQMKYQNISESLWYIFFLVAKGMTYHVTIAIVILLCVKITSYFHVQESWPGIFSDGCIIKLIIIFILSWLLPWVFKISTESFTSLYGEENKLVIYAKICGVLKRFWETWSAKVVAKVSLVKENDQNMCS